MTIKTRWSYRLYFLLASVEAAVAFAALLKFPSGAGDDSLFGFSPARLALLALAAFLTVAAGALCLRTWRKPARLDQVHARLQTEAGQSDMPLVIAFAGLGFFIAGVFFHTITAEGHLPAWQAVFQRLQPLVLWAAAVGLQTALLVFTLFSHPAREGDSGRREVGLGVIAVTLAAAFMGISRFGLRPDNEWLHPNSPILASQVCLALGIALLLLLGLRWLAAKTGTHGQSGIWLDAAFGSAIWLAAFLVWHFTPLAPSFFNPPPVPPNFAFYPNSDAADYDRVGQYLLIGQGFGNHSLVIRPLFSFLLALYRMLAGQSYDGAIILQTALMAFFPVAVYFLGSRLHSRLAGLLAAVLVLLREHNAIALGGVIPGGHSHLKLFMTDVPSAAGLAVLALLVVLWLQSPEKRRWLAPLAGGLLGALLLIRTQSSVLMVAVILSAIVVLFRQPKVMVSGLILFLAGYAVFIAPWMLRNHQLAGVWVVETTPNFFLGGEVRYITGLQDTSLLPGETGPEFDQRMTGILRDYILAHPLEVADFAVNHFFHNELNTALILPLKPDILDLKSYVTGYDFWFGTPGLDLTPFEAAALGLNVALVGVGLGAAFRYGRKEALLLLLFHFGYNASTALARRSGGRYFLPGDWIGLFFFALGLAQILFLVAGRLGSERVPQTPLSLDHVKSDSMVESQDGRGWLRKALIVIFIVLILGSVMPLTEKLIPPRYFQRDKTQTVATLSERWDDGAYAQDLVRIQALAQDPAVEVLWGRGLSPRYFPAGEGIRSAEPLMDMNRLRFEFLGEATWQIVLPLSESPLYFPSGADVIVAGCPADGYMDALVVILPGEGEQPDHVYWRYPVRSACLTADK